MSAPWERIEHAAHEMQRALDRIEKENAALRKERDELELKLYGDPLTDAEIEEFLRTEHKLSAEDEAALKKAHEQFPYALKETMLRIRAEKENTEVEIAC